MCGDKVATRRKMRRVGQVQATGRPRWWPRVVAGRACELLGGVPLVQG